MGKIVGATLVVLAVAVLYAAIRYRDGSKVLSRWRIFSKISAKISTALGRITGQNHGKITDRKLVLTKIHKMLKEGGTLAVFPWSFREQPLEANEHLLALFSLRRFAHLRGASHRALLILVKR
jgi:hypothetical protein